jgi:RNA polymerase sigma-70 factor, ECF subfamily
MRREIPCMDRIDHQLIHDMANGDETAFAAFYDRHADRVLGMLIRLLGRRDEAEDVLQEAFWQLWKCADRYDPARATPLVWFILIARSRALDQFRRRRAETALHNEDDLAIQNDPFLDVERHELARRVHVELQKLPPEQALAVRLAFYGGLTHEQIARSQQVPLGTAKTRIRLGMERLRHLLNVQREFTA